MIVKGGRTANKGKSIDGKVVHIIERDVTGDRFEDGFLIRAWLNEKTICNAKCGKRSYGWQLSAAGEENFCTRCLSKIEKLDIDLDALLALRKDYRISKRTNHAV